MNDVCVFAVQRGNIVGRFDVRNLQYNQSNSRSAVTTVTLGSLTIEEPCYGTSATAVLRTDEQQPKYVRITDFDDFGIDDTHEYMTVETYATKHLLKVNDILFARTGGTVGKTYFYDGSIGEAVFAGYCIRFRFNENKVIPKYVYWCTKTIFYKKWVNGIQRPSGQPNINKEEFKSFEIALPNKDYQQRLVSEMDVALKLRNSKMYDAEHALKSFEMNVADIYNLESSSQYKLCFAIKLKELDGVIDAKRYVSIKRKVGEFLISDVCEVVDEKVNVSRFDKQVIDWIRIDDLPNQPLEIEEIRTQSADEVEGNFFEVRENDILVARLGPTILNQKIVMVHSLERTTIASAEFLVLRCKEGYNPETVMAVLKTAYYRDLMYSHARGSTPSRYRLNREDMLRLPFPDIREHQEQLAIKASQLREKVKTIRAQAEQEWQAAKEQFEKEVFVIKKGL